MLEIISNVYTMVAVPVEVAAKYVGEPTSSFKARAQTYIKVQVLNLQIAMEAEVSGYGNEVKTLTQEKSTNQEQIASLNHQLG